jgi:hypothetical protein
MDDGMVGDSTIVHVFCSINDNPCDPGIVNATLPTPPKTPAAH